MGTNFLPIVENVLLKLIREFDVPVPSLFVDPEEIRLKRNKTLGGWYALDEIHITQKTMEHLFDAVRTARHEFAHHLQEHFGITKKIEALAKKFERDMWALGKPPKSQTLISTFCGISSNKGVSPPSMRKRGELKPHASWKGEPTGVGLDSRKKT